MCGTKRKNVFANDDWFTDFDSKQKAIIDGTLFQMLPNNLRTKIYWLSLDVRNQSLEKHLKKQRYDDIESLFY